MRVIFNHYVKKYLVTSPVGPGPVRFGPGPARSPQNYYLQGPARARKFQARTRPAKYYSGPAHGLRAGPRAEARPVQDPVTSTTVYFNVTDILV